MLIFIVILLFPMVSGILLAFIKRKVEVTVIPEPAMARKSQPCEIKIRITNRSILPISKLEFKLEYQNSICKVNREKQIALSFMGKSTQEIKLHFTPEYVGNILLVLSRVRIWDYSRCLRVNKKIDSRNDVTILPTEKELSERLNVGSSNLFENESVLLNKPGSDLTEILNIREYNQGDRISRIHWKLSGKYEELMIKEYASPLYYYPLFLLDLRNDGDETGIDILNAQMEAFLCMAVWHMEHGQPLEAAYYEIESKRLKKDVISTREELYALMHELYNNVYEDEESQSLQLFYAANEFHLYSNIIYFTAAIQNELELIAKTDLFTAYFDVGEAAEGTEQLVNQLGYGNVSMVNIYDCASSIPAMAHRYMRGSRGDGYGQ